MNARRICQAALAALVLIVFVGCVYLAFAYYVQAWAWDVVSSLLLAALMPAYLVVSIIGTPRRTRPAAAPQGDKTSHPATTRGRKWRHG